MHPPVLGIDLGTTFCAVGFLKGDHVELIPNPQIGTNTIPSMVAFHESKLMAGSAAKSQAYRNIGNTIYDVKRFIGRTFDDEKVQNDIMKWPFSVVADEKGRPVVEG